MTKAEECGRLAEFIASLPKETYLRDFLAHVEPEFRRDIVSDIITTTTPRQYDALCQSGALELAKIKSDILAKREELNLLERKVSSTRQSLDIAQQSLAEFKAKILRWAA